MSTQPGKAVYLRLLIAGIAVVLFSTAAIARMLGWGSSPAANAEDISALEVSAADGESAGPRCPECGVIVSASADGIVVRMADGSSRAIDDANPARWRAGERLIFIAGTDPLRP